MGSRAQTSVEKKRGEKVEVIKRFGGPKDKIQTLDRTQTDFSVIL